jgi:hypothetical protein
MRRYDRNLGDRKPPFATVRKSFVPGDAAAVHWDAQTCNVGAESVRLLCETFSLKTRLSH